MKDMILVTGGAGFIGSHFVRDWLARESSGVINLDKLTYAGNLANLAGVANHPRHHFICGDINDRQLVSRLLHTHTPRAIVHFAAETHVDRSIGGPDAFIETNVQGTCSLLEVAKEYLSSRPDARDFRFLQISTDEVYGTLQPNAPAFTETSPYRPNSPYAASKAAADHLARAWHQTYGLPVLITHSSNNYGPNQFPEKLIPLVLQHALAGLPLPVYGNGLNVRDWLYVTDHCTALRRVLAAGVPGEEYNIGGQAEKTNLEVVETVCALLDTLRPRPDGRPYRELIRFVSDRPGHDYRYAINPGKIETALGWRPAETFIAGLHKTAAWYLAHPEWLGNILDGRYRTWRTLGDVTGEGA